MSYIRYRDERHKLKYYCGMNGQRGRAITGGRSEAVNVDSETAQKIRQQLSTLDERGWEVVEDGK